MSTATSRSRSHVGRLVHLLASLAIVVALVLMPPALPRFGPSLATPLTTTTLRDVALLLAWIALLALTLAMLQRALSPADRQRALAPAWASRIARRPVRRATSLLRVDEAPLPRLLITNRPGGPAVAAEQAGHEDEVASKRECVARILLLGPIQVAGVPRPRRASTLELLAFLALHPAGANRDELLEAMWPDQDPRRTRPRLWQSVSEARRLLGDAFERDGEHYRLDPTHISTDITGLEQLLAAADATAGPAEARPLLDRALALWRGQPLAGTDYAWADEPTRQLAAALARLAERAGCARLAAGDARGALRAAERGLQLDDLNETFVRLTLEAEEALGRRDAVVQRYEAFRQLLDARLGLDPQRETRQLYRRVLGPDEKPRARA